MDSNPVSTIDLQATYPVSYPAGVFVVLSTRHLGPLVSRLRTNRRLKAGRNVTVFDAKNFAELAPDAQSETTQAGNNESSAPLQVDAGPARSTVLATWQTNELKAREREGGLQQEKSKGLVFSKVKLYEMTLREAETLIPDSEVQSSVAATHEECLLITLGDAEAAQHLLTLLQTPRSQRTGVTVTANTTSCASSDKEWPSYMAVHVTGEIPEAELLTYLQSTSISDQECVPTEQTNSLLHQRKQLLSQSDLLQPPVAFVRGVRRFHRVCCPNLRELPSALAALRHSSLLQQCKRYPRERRRKDGSDVFSDVTQHFAVGPQSSGEYEALKVMHSPTLSKFCHPQTAAFTFSELFCGIGMFRTALERVGGQATFAVEFAPPAQMVYALNHSCWHDCPEALQLPNAKEARPDGLPPAGNVGFSLPPVLVGDITEIPSLFFPPHDLLTGGFPCQSFAKAGAAAGLNAEKGWLFYEVVRVLAAAQPAAFLLENVEHLVELESGAHLNAILSRLRNPASTKAMFPCASNSYTDIRSSSKFRSALFAEEEDVLEYEVRHMVVDGGMLTPQTRRRVYFFGFRKTHKVENTANSTAKYEHKNECPRVGEVVAEEVVADALRRLQDAAKSAPYSCVQDLLIVPSAKDNPLRSRGVFQDGDRGFPSSNGKEGKGDCKLQLTLPQWEAVRRSRTFRQNPMWRVCALTGKARTLLGSYRTSYQLYSEFVPYSPTLTLQEVKEFLAKADIRGDSDGVSSRCCQVNHQSSNVDTLPPQPPLRFFSIRECARLQGIGDAFRLPHDDGEDVAATLSFDRENPEIGKKTMPPAVLQQVPSGAVYKLIGNAVNPCVVECLGGAIAAYLQSRMRE